MASKVIQVTVDSEFKKYMLIFRILGSLGVKGFSDSSERELQLYATLLIKRNKLIADGVKDNSHIETLLFTPQSRKEICEMLGIKIGVFNTYLSRIRQSGLITNYTLNYPIGTLDELTIKFQHKGNL